MKWLITIILFFMLADRAGEMLFKVSPGVAPMEMADKNELTDKESKEETAEHVPSSFFYHLNTMRMKFDQPCTANLPSPLIANTAPPPECCDNL